jgi:hypothetical protein
MIWRWQSALLSADKEDDNGIVNHDTYRTQDRVPLRRSTSQSRSMMAPNLSLSGSDLV